MVRRTKRTRTIFHRVADVCLVAYCVICATLAAEAIRDYQEREADRLQRVHLQGMAQGSGMCAKDSL